MSQPADPNASFGLGGVMRSLVWAVYLPSFLVSICLNGITILLPLYVLELGGSAAFAASVIGLRGIGSMVASVPGGLAIARFGDTRVITVGLILVIVSVFGFALTESVAMLAPLALLFGIGTGLWQIGRLNYITEMTTTANRGRAVSVMAGLQRAGFVIGPALGGTMAQLLSFEAFFILCAALYLVICLLVLRFARAGAGTANARSVGLRLLDTAVSNRSVLLRAGLPMICLQVLRASRTLILPLWGAYLGLTPSQIGIAFGLASIIDMLMFYPAGWLIDHVGRRVVLAPAMLLMSASVLLLGLTGSVIGFGFLCVLSGLGNGFSTGIGMTLGGDFAPANGRGEFLGIWRLVGDTGTAGGPFMISVLVGSLGLVPAGAAVGALGLTGFMLVWLVMPETRAKRESR